MSNFEEKKKKTASMAQYYEVTLPPNLVGYIWYKNRKTGKGANFFCGVCVNYNKGKTDKRKRIKRIYGLYDKRKMVKILKMKISEYI